MEPQNTQNTQNGVARRGPPQQRYKTPVIPAKAGTQSQLRMVPVAAVHLGPGFRRDDA
jgi:hypothetical protein